MARIDEPHQVDVHVGKQLRRLRKARYISQTALANALGLTFQQVQKYERGVNRVSASKLYEAAEFLQVPLSVFFDGLPQAMVGTPADPVVIAVTTDPKTREALQAFRALRPDHAATVLSLARELAKLNAPSASEPALQHAA